MRRGGKIGAVVGGIVILMGGFAFSQPAEVVQPPKPQETTNISTESPALVETTQNPEDMGPLNEKKRAFLLILKQDFRYAAVSDIVNPCVPFIQPAKEKSVADMGEEGEPTPPVLLTPLQKMEHGEIERGLKGILWGTAERKAIIEDGAGKGYIVTVGTPVGNQDGVVSAIFQDRIVIRQKVWDRKAKDFVDEEVVIRLRKPVQPTVEEG